MIEVAPTISARTKGGGGLGTDFDCDGGLISRALLGKQNSSHAEDLETYITTPTMTCEGDAHSGFRDEHGLVQEISNALCQRDYKGARPEADQGAPLVCETHGIPGNWIGRQPENGGNAVQPMENLSPNLTKTDKHAVQSGMMVRRITPREAERLQGFPDDFTLIAIKTRASGIVNYSKDGPRYKSLGNSMAVPVLRWIGKRILLVNQIP